MFGHGAVEYLAIVGFIAIVLALLVGGVWLGRRAGSLPRFLGLRLETYLLIAGAVAMVVSSFAIGHIIGLNEGIERGQRSGLLEGHQKGFDEGEKAGIAKGRKVEKEDHARTKDTFWWGPRPTQ